MIPASRFLAPGPSRARLVPLLELARHVHQSSAIETNQDAKSRPEPYSEGSANPARLQTLGDDHHSGEDKKSEYRHTFQHSSSTGSGNGTRGGRSFRLGPRRTDNSSQPRESMGNDWLSISTRRGKVSGFEWSSQGPPFPPKSQYKAKYTSSIAKQSAIRPAVQSVRVQELASGGNFDEAIQLVYTAPRYTLNTATWNTLLKVLMDAGKRKEAYTVYIEMKRRGFEPFGMTFSTMIRGFASVHDWSAQSNMLQRSEKIFEDCMDYTQKCIAKNTVDPRLIISFNCYISLLGRAGQWQKAVDVYYNLENLKPLAADAFTYAALFDGLAQRKDSDRKGELTMAEQNAADAKFFWRRLEKERETGNIAVDAQLVRKFLDLLPHGRPADHLFGLEVIRDYVGLVAPGETAPKSRIQMDQYLLNTIMGFCNKTKKHRLCITFYRQVAEMQKSQLPEAQEISLSKIYIIKQVLTAQGQLTSVAGSDESASAIAMLHEFYDRRVEFQLARAKNVTANNSLEARFDAILHSDVILLALIVCWRCADWASALEVLSMGTRTPVADLISPSAGKPRIPNSRLGLDYSAFSYLARTALASEDVEGMRQFLHIAGTWRIAQQAEESKRFYPFYRTQYHEAVLKIIEAVRADNSKKAALGEEVKEGETYEKLMNECNVWEVKQQRSYGPEHEDNVFGSARQVDKLTQAIDFEMATRSQ